MRARGGGSSAGLATPLPLGLLVALAVCECDAHPVDQLECESEVVAGYFVDQGGALFCIIYLSAGLLATTWSIYVVEQGGAAGGSRGGDRALLLGCIYAAGSSSRYTLIRYRMDQILWLGHRWAFGGLGGGVGVGLAAHA